MRSRSPRPPSRSPTRSGRAGLDGLVNNAGIAVMAPLETIPARRPAPPARGQPDLAGRGDAGDAAADPHGARPHRLPQLDRRPHGVAVRRPYHAAKYGIEAVVDCLRQELRPWKIDVVAIEPGSIATPIWERGERHADEVAERAPAARRRSTARRSSAFARRSPTPPSAASRRRRWPTRSSTRSAPAAAHPLPGRRRRPWPGAAVSGILPDRLMDRIVARAMGI